MSSKILAIAAIMAVAGASILALVSVPTYAAIEPVTRCDGEVDEDGCPGSSATKGQGHDETTQNENPSGKAPPGQN
jgi:hypothetical protein